MCGFATTDWRPFLSVTTVKRPFAATRPEWTHVEGNEESHVVWYRVTAKYHDDLVGSATVTIRRRELVYASGNASKVYDGSELTTDTAWLSGDGFVGTEGAVTNDFAWIVDPGVEESTFAVSFNGGTSARDYVLTRKFGTLRVFDKDVLGVEAASEVWTFDDADHSTNGFTVVGNLKEGDYVVPEITGKVHWPDEGLVENFIKTARVYNAKHVDVTTNYVVETISGVLAVTPAEFEDLVVEGVVTNYDGEAHTIKAKVVGEVKGTVGYWYSEGPAGPWSEKKPEYRDAGTYTVYCKASARGYRDRVASAEVVIAPREVTLLSASATRAYDGEWLVTNELRLVEGSFVEGQGFKATAWTSEIRDVGFTDNMYQYELTNVVNRKNYRVTPLTGTLTVTPGRMTALIVRSVTNNYSATGHAIVVDAGMYPDSEVRYSRVLGGDRDYGEENPAYTNVGEYVTYVKVTAPNYAMTLTNASVTVERRPVEIHAELQEMVYGDLETLSPGFADANAWSAKPVAGVAESGLAEGDFVGFVDLVFSKNHLDYVPGVTNYAAIVTNPAPAAALFAISNRVLGTEVTANYEIFFEPGDLSMIENLALFKATLKWQYSGAATFFASLTVENTNRTARFKYDPGSLRFSFADRTVEVGGKNVNLKLWEYPAGGPNRAQEPVEEIGGTSYRAFYLADPDPSDAERGGWKPHEPVHYGPKEGETLAFAQAFAAYNGVTPQLYRSDRKADFANEFEGCVGYLMWTSEGALQTLPLVTDGELPRVLESVLSAFPSAVPLTAERLNEALAYGLRCDGSEPSCEITGFAVDGDRVTGSIRTSNGVSSGVPSANAKVTLEGADELGAAADWTPASADVSDGEFAAPNVHRFYRVRLSVGTETFR